MVKEVDTCLLVNVLLLTKFLTACKIIKISELPPDSHCVIKMMLTYKITEEKVCMSLCEHHNVKFAENDATVYRPCF